MAETVHINIIPELTKIIDLEVSELSKLKKVINNEMERAIKQYMRVKAK